MQPIPGKDCHCSDSSEGQQTDSKACDDCGARLEWSLGLDGVQFLECPDCGFRRPE
ncbi:hypothetical protein [Halorussus ruber]|uniref:hypothetical protein n=1 Tax=Halorussus ruber TaxID=1126238 RepID=UPI00143DC4B7|nr:hypothetical protein [Halorussus ruber]